MHASVTRFLTTLYSLSRVKFLQFNVQLTVEMWIKNVRLKTVVD